MKLSLVFELLLIFVLLAFAASKSVKKYNTKKGVQQRNDDDKSEENGINKYCKCSEAYCNCCRDFSLPLVNLSGPGCASLMYLNDDKMSVSLSFGKKVITNRTLSGRKPSPVCMPLPGGVSKFCGRVYNIARAGEEFRACLGLELQAKRTVEAAVRVSCFKFGPRGVTSEPADPLPLVPQDEKDEDDEDDDDEDDEDDFGLGGDEDEDEDDDDDDEDDDEDDGDLDAANDVDSVDYTGFSLIGEDLLGDLFGSSGGKKSNKNKKKQAPYVPVLSSTTTRRPRPTRRPARRPSTRITTERPTRSTTVRIRPVNRRPTRRPTKKPEESAWPQRKPVTENTPITLSTFTVTTLERVPDTQSVQSTANIEVLAEAHDHSTAAVIVQKPESNLPVTVATIDDVNDFEDPGLEMSLAHITGQLSSMQVTPLLPTTVGDQSIQEKEQINYEKVETITPKQPSTATVSATPAETINDDMIQVVQTLDSQEITPEIDTMAAEESRAHWWNSNTEFESFKLPKRKNRNEIFGLDDLDVLDLTEIGESIGDQFGIFGGKRRQNKQNKEVKLRDERGRDNDEYDDILDTLTDTLIMRRSGLDSKNRKDRRRQNKMMREEWS